MLFSIGGAIVLSLYFPLKHSEIIPGYLSAGFAYLGAGLLVTVIWLCIDVLVNVNKASEDVISKLRSMPSSPRNPLEKLRLKGVLKRAKALTPLTVPIGDFGTMSLDVPVVFVEEIINQLLFFLTV